jgi:hypothetical protein
MEEQKKENKKGAKDYSLFSMIFSGVWIIALTLLKGFDVIKLSIMEEIIPSGIAIAGVFSPIYFSIFLDKIKDIRFNDSNKRMEQ